MQSDRKSTIGFICQKCHQPLSLDSSFSSVPENKSVELTQPITTPPEVILNDNVTDHLISPFHLDYSETSTSGFTFLGTHKEPSHLSHFMKVSAQLFDNLSSGSDIDHPLCEECADLLIELLDKQLQIMEQEEQDYKNLFVKLNSEPCDEDIESLRKELRDLQMEEERLRSEVVSAQKEEQAISKEINELELQNEKLNLQEESYWREYVKNQYEYNLIEDESKMLKCQLDYTNRQLEKLKKTDVYNATFHIWYSGHFGTINNFKLGRLPSAPVDWSEINAAWGQAALLLSALANKMNLQFEKFRLVPYGNHSYIEVISEKKVLPLYGSGGFRFLWDNKFDSAMTAFLDCLRQFKEKVEQDRSGFRLPYHIENNKLVDSEKNSYSIKIQFNSEEHWTKALKYLLTNLKWGLAWVTSEVNEEQTQLPINEYE